MNNFIPDIYAKNIFTINYKKLKENGIKCLLFDLDNTMAPMSVKEPSKELKELFRYLDDLNFKLIIVSNSGQKRVAPFKEQLNVDSAFCSFKPFSHKYKKIISLYKFKECEVGAIGDQLLTDIYGANNMGFTSILVDRLGEDPFFGTKFNRFIEKFIFKNLNKRGIYEAGKYYD
jgi:uncharacterized protein